MSIDESQTEEPQEEIRQEETAVDPIAMLEDERDQLRALAQRTQADFVNYKRRVEEERLTVAQQASNRLIAKLLPLVDDLQRGLGALPANSDESWTEGMKLIFHNMEALIAAEGVIKFEPQAGDPFDPGEHDAVYHEPSDEQIPGCVLETISAGYRSRAGVLRPARVAVAKAPAQDSSDESTVERDGA